MTTQPIILAAVDLDRRAAAVIEQAARLAALCQARLAVAHVVDDAAGYEADHTFPQRPGDLRESMTRYARAWLVGMINHLDLPNGWVEVLVETGPVTATLAALVVELQPRYCLMGPARLGPLSPSAGLAAAIGGRSRCELMTIQAKPGGEGVGLGRWLRQWITGHAGVTGRHA
ncbi:MAG: universal stress protein [Bdellovibrio bacteriovorus]